MLDKREIVIISPCKEIYLAISCHYRTYLSKRKHAHNVSPRVEQEYTAGGQK